MTTQPPEAGDLREVLPVDDWQWLADQLRAWPVKRVHPDRTMCDGALRPMAADVIEAALAIMKSQREAKEIGPRCIDERLLVNLERLRSWCIHQDANATIWLHIDEAIRALKDAERQRRIAIEWANKSVDSVKEAMWEAQDALRARAALSDDDGKEGR